jgi:hypothetical protein
MPHQNAMDAENGAADPRWTTPTTFSEQQTPQERFSEHGPTCIGPRAPTSFSRQHVIVGDGTAGDYISTTQESYPWKEAYRGIHIPDHTVMQTSGFANAAATAGPRPSGASPPDCSTYRSAYRSAGERSPAGRGPIRKAGTGYGANASVVIGPPGDPRQFRTGTTMMSTQYRDPDQQKPPTSGKVANAVEPSGYWAA